jgi:predicted nucleic acid-binding protein
VEVIDTFAWIEYFAGSERGRKVKDYIESGEAVTPSVVIAEFTDKYIREGVNPDERLKFIRTKTAVTMLDDDLAESAGRISAERRKTVKRWGLLDSCVLATARIKGARVVTGDLHFEDLDETIRI